MDIANVQSQLHKIAVEIQDYAQKLANIDPKHSYIERLNLASQMTSQAINHLGHLIALIENEQEQNDHSDKLGEDGGNV